MHIRWGRSRSRTKSSLAAALIVLVCLVGPAAIAAPTYSLEIIQPRPGLNTSNRYYKAYPGFPYNVQISAIGGKYPYQYSLTTAPSGMSVDAKTGVISWSNPVAQGQPYGVSAQVRDANGTSVSVQWTVLVTTQGFKFIDGNNGRTVSQGGDGSAGNPWRTISDWYVSKYDTSNKGAFLYWRAGTYRTNAAPIEDGWRLAMTGGYKPLIWLAYPGDAAPIIDTTGSHVSIYGGHDNLYFEGLAFKNFTTGFGVNIESSADNVTFRRNTFSNLPAGAGGTGTNASALMINRGADVGTNWALVDNTFQAIHDIGYGILGYSTTKNLVQGNRFSDFTVSSAKAIGPKTNNTKWFIRDNRIDISAGQGIWVDTYSYTGDIEISYNLVQVDSGYTLWVGQEPNQYGPITSFRNTYVGAPVQVDNLTSTSGPVSFNNDVIVNSTSSVNKITSALTSRLQIGTVLSGSTSSGIVDGSGNLTGDYIQYVGIHGYQQTQTSTVKPDPPTSVTVQ